MADELIGDALIELARASIWHGLRTGEAMTPDLSDAPAAITEPAACFVTLTRQGQLRGCVGCLRARRPLGEQVATSAFHAAFADPRMVPVDSSEVDLIDISVSVLSALKAIDAASDDELVGELVPGRDGLLAELPADRATFLPKVWQDLPDSRGFLAGLKQKAGLRDGDWPAGTRFYRYTTTDYSSSAPDR